jgi:hypothetical protein
MGHEILYCATCQTQLRGPDFEKAHAYKLEGKSYCRKCAPDAVKSLPADKVEALLRQSGQSSTPSPPSNTERIMRVAAPPPTRRSTREEESRSGFLIGIGIAAAAIVVVVIAMAVSNGSSASREPRSPSPGPPVAAEPGPSLRPEVPKTSASGPSGKEEKSPARRNDLARESLRKARDFARLKPADVSNQIVLYEQAAWDARDTDLQDLARSELRAVQDRQRDGFLVEIKSIEEKARPLEQKEAFRAAIAVLDEARGIHGSPVWTACLDQSVGETRARAGRLLAPLLEKAADARRRGAETEVREIRERIARWELPDSTADLEKVLAGAAAPPPSSDSKSPPATPEAQGPQKAWSAAMALASGRDYAGAIQGLERVRQGTQDAALKSQITTDLDLLRLLAAASDDALKALAKTPKGQKLELVIFNEAGNPQSIEGSLVRAEPGRLTLKVGEKWVEVPTGEITSGSLSELIQGRQSGKQEAVRLVGLLCSLEGDLDGLRKNGAGVQSTIPPKYQAVATEIAGRRSDPEVENREAEARKLYYSAEADFAVPARMLAALEKFSSLTKSFEDTLFARRNSVAIKGRLEGGREYVFFPDMLRGEGSFHLSRNPKAGPNWTSEADSPAANRKDNFVELEFSVLPQVEYRCWVYVGGCCGETLEFFYQASELSGPSASSKEVAPMEPGAPTFAAARHGLSTSTKKHAAHGGPKQATRWGWVQLPLPKFTLPGSKKVRVLTDQQGFSVAYALVSSVRSAPPLETEFREMQKSRPEIPNLVAKGPVGKPSEKVILRFDFEDGPKSAAWSRGKVESGPARPGNKYCLASEPSAYGPAGDVDISVVLPSDPTKLRLRFRYWSCGNEIGAMFLDDTAQRNIRHDLRGAAEGQWAVFDVALSEFACLAEPQIRFQKGNKLSHLHLYTLKPGGGTTYWDDIELVEIVGP